MAYCTILSMFHPPKTLNANRLTRNRNYNRIANPSSTQFLKNARNFLRKKEENRFTSTANDWERIGCDINRGCGRRRRNGRKHGQGRRESSAAPKLGLWYMKCSIRYILRKARAFYNEFCCDTYDAMRGGNQVRMKAVDPYFSIPVQSPPDD